MSSITAEYYQIVRIFEKKIKWHNKDGTDNKIVWFCDEEVAQV